MYARKYLVGNISYKDYKELIKFCVICKFDKIVELHHLNENHKDNKKENLIGLCPNCHRMIHSSEFKKEMKNKIIESSLSARFLPKVIETFI